MKYFAILLLLLCGCQKETTVEIKQDGAAVSVSIPQDASAADLINMQTALNNALTIKAKREEQAFQLAEAKLRKSERQFYAVLVVVGVVTGIVSIFAITCGVLIWKFGGILK